MDVSNENDIRIAQYIDPPPSPRNRPPSYRVRCIPKDHVKLGDMIGRGGYSCVYRGTFGTMSVAVKQINMESRMDDAEANEMVRNELGLLARLRDSNFVIQVVGYYTTDFCVSIVMAYAENGDLRAYLHKGHLKGDWFMKAQICIDVAKAVDAVHRAGICHGDLKASNILLDGFFTAKLADFGYSKTFTSFARGSKLGETLRWMAPERIKNSNSLADEQLILADVYGYGLIMWEIFTDGRRPYEDYDDKEVISFKIQSHSQRLNPLEDIGNLPLDVPRVLRDLVHQCLAPEPSHRPTLAVILESLDFYIDTAPPSLRFYHSGPLHKTTNNFGSLSEDLSGLGTSVDEGEVSQLSGLQQEDFRGGMYYFTKGRYSDAIEYFKKAELQDNSLSQRMLGHCYRAINKDVESFSSFKKAATGGDIKGQCLLAWCYEHQYGTRQHDELAFSLYKISSENGNLEAAIRLCDTKWIKYIYSTIAQDTDESARKWLNTIFKLAPSNYDALTTKICELAEAGDPDSQYLLAWLYSSALLRKGGEDRADDSFVWLVKSGIGGNQLAQLKFYSRLDPDVYSNNILKSKTPTPDHCAKIFQLLMDAAQAGAAGSSFSQCGVGICFQHGIGTAISTNESFEWYHKAAQAGDAHAQWKLGMIYYQGIDIIQDSKMAFGWLTKAANAGSAGAQNVLGICYELGKGTKVDLQRAFQLYLQAAETGNVEAIYNTGICYANGKGVEKDHSQAFQRFSKAAEAGHVDAICHTGICYANGMGVEKDENQAFQRFSKAAETGNVDAIYNTGISYANGMGVGLDINQAFQRFFKAAEAGCVEAMYTTGDCYANGIGVGKDDEQAFQMFSEAAEAGHVDAMYKIGICYEKGTGTEKDYNQAFRWYFKAVKAGHAIAQVDLGNLYLDGKGTEQDRDAANKWYIEAAMYNLGQSHEFDREQNLAKAKKWFMKGVKRDYKFEQKTPETKICQSCDAGDVDAQRQLIDVRPSFGRLLDFRRLRRVFPIMKGRY